jgi:hypothetical protein
VGVISSVLGGVSDRLVPILQTPVEDIIYEVLDQKDLPSRAKVRDLGNRIERLEGTLGELATALEGLKTDIAGALKAAEAAREAAAKAPAPAPAPAAPKAVAKPKPKPKPKPKVAGGRTCKVADCGGAIRAKGFCGKHYQKFKRSTLEGYVGADGATVFDGVRYQVSEAHLGLAVSLKIDGDDAVFDLGDDTVTAKLADARLG